MNIQNNRNWATLLRSGVFIQIESKLQDAIDPEHPDRTGYCCLGAACDMSRLGKWERDEDHGKWYYRTSSGRGDEELPDSPVQNFFGWTSRECPLLIPPGPVWDKIMRQKDIHGVKLSTRRDDRGTVIETIVDATDLNDSFELSFDEIADCIDYTCDQQAHTLS